MGVSKISKVLIFSALCMFAALSAAIDTTQRSSSVAGIISKEAKNKAAIEKSIQSSVRVISSFYSAESEGVTSTSSGTYLEHDGVTYVLTAPHSIIGFCENTYAIADDLMYQCEAVILLNNDDDVAILQIAPIMNRTPIKILKNLYPENELRKSVLIHDQIVYTGYPQGLGPLTFDGKIVSQPTEIGYIFAHTYAWSGSSGSGVFDMSGRLIGLITAVSVANSEYGVDVMEDLVIITPISLTDVSDVF